MKCPKCSYLGFETGDRCKNCGYDFSLLATHVPPVDAELTLREPEESRPAPDIWLDRVDSAVRDAPIRASIEPAVASSATTVTAVSTAPAPHARELSFPLFAPTSEDDDEPLIKLPAAPRPPLAVRRTPDQPHLRPSARMTDIDEGRLALDGGDEIAPIRPEPVETTVAYPAEAAASSVARRAAAGLIDHGILFGIDFLVIYSTLRMSALTVGDWALLPPLPMLAFLGLLKLSYFGGFTAACGQTIGKMAMRIRVVADDVPLDPARAARRTLMSAVSLLAAGTGFIPVFVDPDHRALHDRVAGTRVVELPSA